MSEKLSEVDHFISDEVMEYASKIINEAKALNGRQMYDELNVKDSIITDYSVKQDVYEIKVYLQSRYMDYIMDLSNNKVIRGNNFKRIEVHYNLTFTKNITGLKQEEARKCPGCGAPISVNTSGLCAYCGAIYNQEDYDWVLTKIEKV